MHRVIAGERQAGYHDLGLLAWHNGVGRQGVARDAVVRFGVERSVIERDPGAARIAGLRARTEAADHVGVALAGGVLQGHQKSAGHWRDVAIVAAAPGIHVDHAVRGDGHLPGMADMVGEDCRAEARRERDAAIVARTGLRSGRVARSLRVRNGRDERQHADDGQGHRRPRRHERTV